MYSDPLDRRVTRAVKVEHDPRAGWEVSFRRISTGQGFSITELTMGDLIELYSALADVVTFPEEE